MKKQTHPRAAVVAAVGLLLAAISAAPVLAQDAQVVYLQGTVQLKKASGVLAPIDFGTPITAGDTVITGRDGLADLQQGSVNSISLQPNTVFTLQKRIVNDQPQPVLTTILGSVSFKLQRVAGAEPGIASMSTLAGVRGTEFTVFAGDDGSTLIAVTAGVVDVQSAGQTVTLNQDEQVEVAPGAPPSAKQVLRGKLDFSQWNQSREAQITTDPAGALASAGEQLDAIIANLEPVAATYESLRSQLDAGRAQMQQIKKDKGQDAATSFYKENVLPLEIKTSNTFLNVRYWALSAQSLRQFVIGGIYLREKAASLASPGSSAHADFLSAYRAILDRFNKNVTKYLSSNDV